MEWDGASRLVTLIDDSYATTVDKILQGETRNLKFGGYSWRVLDTEDDHALLITEYVIEDRRQYNKEFVNTTWETSYLRTYLNGKFLQTFSKEEQEDILETQISTLGNVWYDIDGGNDTQDKIFVLSLEEADRYFGDSGDYLNSRIKVRVENGEYIDLTEKNKDTYYSYTDFFSNAYDSERVAADPRDPIGWARGWWLRSPGNSDDSATFITSDGSAIVSGCAVYNYCGVRPAIWLKL